MLIATVLFILFGACMYWESAQYEKINPSSILRFSEAISRGEYSAINAERILGKDGYIAILDSQGNLLYQSNKAKAIPAYTTSELELIEEYNSNKYLQSYEIESEGKRLFCAITMELLDDRYMATRIMVVDEDLNIVYQLPDSGRKRITQNERDILSTDTDSGYRLTRFQFTDRQGSGLTLLTFSPRTVEDTLFDKIDGIYTSVFFSFLLLYCVIIFFIIIWLNHKVKKPLALLQEALNETANGNLELKVDYHGPREFVEICDSFNHMSEKLYASEKARLQLEDGRRKLLADISHDLKTPITVIQGYANAVNDGIVPPEKQGQYLHTICVKADMLNELINTFHTYSKLEHPNYLLNTEPCDICNYLRDCMAEKYNELELAGFSLEVDIPETHIHCSIDTQQLKRAFENIVSNFLRYSQAGDTFYCTLEVQKNSVCITLADNGAGIPEKIAETIFEPFSVGEQSRSKNGSGLGLAITKKIITAHGGTIRLVIPPRESYKTQFQIVLPRLTDNK